MLSFNDHSRDFNSFIYVYPVLSRRSQGISLGINLNINNACNWRCVYCQVEGLVRGKPTDIDLSVLENELDYMLGWITTGDFLSKFAPAGLQCLNDICISGNGEPTLSPQFEDVVKIIASLRAKYKLVDTVKSILITNGSEINKSIVQNGLKLLAQNNGEIWFKLDKATSAGMKTINQVSLSLPMVAKNLHLATQLCKTYIQTCVLRLNGKNPEEPEISSYIDFICQFKGEIEGVLLYSVARNPTLPEGVGVSSVSFEYLQDIAARIKHSGIAVKYYL